MAIVVPEISSKNGVRIGREFDLRQHVSRKVQVKWYEKRMIDRSIEYAFLKEKEILEDTQH